MLYLLRKSFDANTNPNLNVSKFVVKKEKCKIKNNKKKEKRYAITLHTTKKPFAQAIAATVLSITRINNSSYKINKSLLYSSPLVPSLTTGR